MHLPFQLLPLSESWPTVSAGLTQSMASMTEKPRPLENLSAYVGWCGREPCLASTVDCGDTCPEEAHWLLTLAGEPQKNSRSEEKRGVAAADLGSSSKPDVVLDRHREEAYWSSTRAGEPQKNPPSEKKRDVVVVG